MPTKAPNRNSRKKAQKAKARGEAPEVASANLAKGKGAGGSSGNKGAKGTNGPSKAGAKGGRGTITKPTDKQAATHTETSGGV